MRKKIAVLLIFTMIFASIGCSSAGKSRNTEDDDIETEETEDTEEPETTDSTTGETPAHTEKPEPETSGTTADTTSQTGSEADLSQCTVKDLIGEINGDVYTSDVAGVKYTLASGSSFGDRKVLQSSYGSDPAMDTKLTDVSALIPVAGTYSQWADGSNFSIAYQINQMFTDDMLEMLLETNKSACESSLAQVGYTVDKSEISSVKIGSKDYDSIHIESHNAAGQHVTQEMVLTYRNGVLVFFTATTLGSVSVEEMFKGVELV